MLFSTYELKSLTLKNRIVMSPMCQYTAKDGFANDWHLVHLGSRAVGGAAVILQEATAVSPEGRITPNDLGLWQDEHISKLQQITTFIEKQGAIPGIQLAHAGRKASTSAQKDQKGKFLKPAEGGWPIVAPSAIPQRPDSGIPEVLDKKGIEKIITDFSTATQRAVKAGYKILEIHAAHGYLLHEFLSPLSNLRTDEYGGNFENRIRLLTEVVDAVRKVWPPELPLWVRISATDWANEGWDWSQSVRLANVLYERGIDVLDVSSGGLIHTAPIPVNYGYQLPFASQIKKESSIKIATVGLITDAVQAETILVNGNADLIVMGRELLRDPYFPLHASQKLQTSIPWPLPYKDVEP